MEYWQRLLGDAINMYHEKVMSSNLPAEHISFLGEDVNEVIRGGRKRDTSLELHNEFMQSQNDVTVTHLD